MSAAGDLRVAPQGGGGEMRGRHTAFYREHGVLRLSASLAVIAVATLLALLLLVPALALDFPVLTGRVIDDAGILDAGTRAALTQKLDEFEAKTSDQLVVVTLKSLQGTSVEDFGIELGRHWQIGQKGKNNGVLLIVAPNERKVRIEVGYGLEGALTDAVSRLIIENAITPRFRAGDFAGGITRGVDDIVSVLTGDAAEWQQRAAKRPEPTTRWDSILIMLLVFAVFGFVFLTLVGTIPRDRGRGRSGGGWSSGSSAGSGWSFGSSDGGFSGGVFSGGGGSFGGGG